MKTCLFLLLCLFSVQYSFSQKRYIVFNDSISAVKRIAQINPVLRQDCKMKKDFITKTYGIPVSDSTHTKWYVEVLLGYEKYFTKYELDNSIVLDNNFIKRLKK